MSNLKTTLLRIASIAVGLMLLPIFVFVGLALVGIAAVAGIVGSVALRHRMNQMREDMMEQQKNRFKKDKFENGPIIDADPA